MATVDARELEARLDTPHAPADGARAWYERLVVPAVVVVLVGAAVARLVARSDLWLDERLTYNIARLPLGEIPEALRRDGSPPLYYLLLHGWMRVVGDSDLAARLLSGIFGVVSLPLAWLSGRRAGQGDRRVAWIATLLLAASPFAVRYATEVRMYSLVVLLVLAGFLAVANALERPTFVRLAAVAVVSGLLALTHYWALYLVIVTAGDLAWQGWRRRDAAARRVAAAIVAGGVLMLPWLPVLAFQLRHTGAPWGRPAGFGALVSPAFEFAGGGTDAGLLLGTLLLAIAGLALLRHRQRTVVRRLAVLTWGTLAVAVVLGMLTGSAFAPRYAAVVLAPFLVLGALGVATLPSNRVRLGVVAAAVALGACGIVPNVNYERTQAPYAARAINRLSHPGDVVVYCPDQLGPSVSHHVDADVVQVTFPTGAGPTFVDWVDYGDRNKAAKPEAFARDVLARAGAHDIWVVWAPSYRTLGTKCQALVGAVATARPGPDRPVRRKKKYFERISVVHFAAR